MSMGKMVNTTFAAAPSDDPPGASRIVSACVNLCNQISSAAARVTSNIKACTYLSDLAQVTRRKLEAAEVGQAEEAVARIQGFLECGLEAVTRCTMYDWTYLLSFLRWHSHADKELSGLRSNIHVYLSMLLTTPAAARTTCTVAPLPACSWYSECEKCRHLAQRQERHSKFLADRKSLDFLVVEKKGIIDAYERHYIFQDCLAIVWGDVDSYWKRVKTPGSLSRSVANLRDVCWLELRGTATCHFEPGRYTLSWRLRWDDDESRVFGWTEPVTFSFHTDASRQSAYRRTPVQPATVCDLQVRSVGGGWKEYDVGEFTVADRESAVAINFSMLEVTGARWKGGLFVDAVVIQPTSSLSGVPIPRHGSATPSHRLFQRLPSATKPAPSNRLFQRLPSVTKPPSSQRRRDE
ncbi:hypothetical protein AXG93_3242s1320 [Marchantia polymorpha subsp. ruderalis]|uniref:Uncharacterized protein n=1 Tax=Marchantia polymorpha subsp. ruderalis TaxID=1480154 RepID=A0A176WGZ7_MARPO|nr:hypothetical protein AXG93_3242s1320 [Marchantia polymorpha subsp. ruderalis]